MKILSIDVGIKNLAYCLLEIVDQSFNYIISDWDVLDLTNSCKESCSYVMTTKGKEKKQKPCKNKAKYTRDGKYYCRLHAKFSNYKIPTNDICPKQIKKIKKYNIKKLKTFMIKHEINFDKCEKKQNYFDEIYKDISENYLHHVNKENATSLDLVYYGQTMRKAFMEKINYDDISLILIENQIGPLALRMKSLQAMIMQHFIENGVTNIRAVNSINKLKPFIDLTVKTNYSQRKKLSIEYTKKLLKKEEKISEWEEMFGKHKKKDDLADCFLQVRWYIFDKKLIIKNAAT